MTIIGYTDLSSRLPGQSSQLYGTNLVNALKLMTPGKDGNLVIDFDDEVVRNMTIVRDLTSGYGELVERAGVGTAFTYVVMLTALAYLSWRIRSRVAEALGGDVEAPRLRPRMLTCLAVAELSIHIIVNAAGYQHAQEIVAGILAVLLVGVYALQVWRRRVASIERCQVVAI